MTTTTTTGGQVGRSLPRLEAREKVTGRAEYTHTMRLPGMLHGKIFRSTVAHGRIKSIDVERRAEACPASTASSPSDDVRKVIPEPYYGPAFHDQPILAIDKVHYVGEPVAVVLAADPHVAEEAAQLIVAEYEELPAVFDEVEAADNKALVHDELKPAGTFADLKHLKGRKGTNIALDFRLRTRRRRQGLRRGRARVRAHLPHPEGAASRARAAMPRSATGRRPASPSTARAQGPSFVRTEIARLLGWPENRVRIKVPYLGGGFGGKLYIKLEALVTALVDDRAAAGEDRAHHGGAVLHHHQAPEHVPHQERRRQGRPHHRAQVRGVLERRRLRGHRPAGDAEVGLHRVRALRHRERLRSIPTRSTPTCRRPARCAASASRSWCGPTRATPT